MPLNEREEAIVNEAASVVDMAAAEIVGLRRDLAACKESEQRLHAEKLALRTAVRDAKTDRDALRRVLAEILAGSYILEPALRERAHELVTRHPFDPETTDVPASGLYVEYDESGVTRVEHVEAKHIRDAEGRSWGEEESGA